MPFKRLVLFVFFSFFISACATSANHKSTLKIAQAMKKEGDIFQAQGNYSAALIKLLGAEKLTPSDPYLQNSLGLAYMGKKRDDLAVTAFKKAISKKPDYIEAVNNLGAAYLRQGKLDLSIETFNRVLESLLYPTPHFPLSNIGWAYMRKKQFSNAETYFMKALDRHPWFLAASHGLAQVYLRTGRLNPAMAYLHKCISRSPGSAILHADLAQAYEGKGETRQAIASWKRVLTLTPERSPLAKQAELSLSKLR